MWGFLMTSSTLLQVKGRCDAVQETLQLTSSPRRGVTRAPSRWTQRLASHVLTSVHCVVNVSSTKAALRCTWSRTATKFRLPTSARSATRHSRPRDDYCDTGRHTMARRRPPQRRNTARLIGRTWSTGVWSAARSARVQVMKPVECLRRMSSILISV